MVVFVLLTLLLFILSSNLSILLPVRSFLLIYNPASLSIIPLSQTSLYMVLPLVFFLLSILPLLPQNPSATLILCLYFSFFPLALPFPINYSPFVLFTPPQFPLLSFFSLIIFSLTLSLFPLSFSHSISQLSE